MPTQNGDNLAVLRFSSGKKPKLEVILLEPGTKVPDLLVNAETGYCHYGADVFKTGETNPNAQPKSGLVVGVFRTDNPRHLTKMVEAVIRMTSEKKD